MKKALPLLLILCFLWAPEGLKAQHDDFILGIESGMGIRSLKGHIEGIVVGKTAMGIGQTGGISLQYYFSNEFCIKVGLLYAKKGAKSKWEYLDDNGNRISFQTTSLEFNYISFPFLFRYELGKKVKYFANLGPFLSVLVGNPSDQLGSVIDITDDLNSLDFGMSSGIGVQFPLQKKLHISLELRNDLGLVDISNFPFPNPDRSLQSRTTNLLLGVFWKLK